VTSRLHNVAYAYDLHNANTMATFPVDIPALTAPNAAGQPIQEGDPVTVSAFCGAEHDEKLYVNSVHFAQAKARRVIIEGAAVQGVLNKANASVNAANEAGTPPDQADLNFQAMVSAAAPTWFPGAMQAVLQPMVMRLEAMEIRVEVRKLRGWGIFAILRALMS
jgi:hypothetical protein